MPNQEIRLQAFIYIRLDNKPSYLPQCLDRYRTKSSNIVHLDKFVAHHLSAEFGKVTKLRISGPAPNPRGISILAPVAGMVGWR